MSEQRDSLTYRVLVFSRNGTEILLMRSPSGVHLPEVTIPTRERIAESVTSAMKQEFGEVVVCLFEPDSSGSARTVRYVATRHWRTCETSAGLLQWGLINDLLESMFGNRDDYRAVRESLARCRFPISNTPSGPFSALNWFDELYEWVEHELSLRGLHLTGAFQQLNASPTFSLIRFETNGPAVWFKAVGEPNEREFPITLRLTKLFGKYTPEFIAALPSWNGWLMREASGIELAEVHEAASWKAAATALAKLQIDSISICGSLLDSGILDLRGTTLAARVFPFMDVVAQLMREQPRVPPPVLSAEELTLLASRIREAIVELDDFRVPDTLGHLDLNPGNIFIASDGCSFLDWSEAYFGQPFYSFQYLLEYHVRVVGKDSTIDAGLTDSYLGPWIGIVPAGALAEAMAIMPLLAPFAYAVAGTDIWRESEYLQNPRYAGYLRALTRRMNHEANKLGERRTSCLI